MLFLEELIRNPKSRKQIKNVPGVLLHTRCTAQSYSLEVDTFTVLALARPAEIIFILQKIENMIFRSSLRCRS